MDIQVDKDAVLEFKLPAPVVHIILAGLDELKNKINGVELLLMQQIQAQAEQK